MTRVIFIVVSFFFVNVVLAQYTSIPDNGFEYRLIELGIDSDGIINGQVLTSDIETVEFLDLSEGYYDNIIGIEDFTSLKVIDLTRTYWTEDTNYPREKTTVDLSMVPSLEEIYIDADLDYITCNVEVLKLNNNPNLQYISSYGVWFLSKIDLKGTDEILNDYLFINYDVGYWDFTCDDVPAGFILCVEVSDINSPVSASGCSTVTTDCEAALSVTSFDAPEFLLYPNPTSDFFHIESNVSIESVIVYDLKGRIVQSFDSDVTKYSVSEIASGMYIVEIQTEEGLQVRKQFIKE